MAQLEKRDITRININLPTHTVNKVKEYAEELGLPITQAYTVLINMALDQKDVIKLVPNLIKSITDLKDLSDSQNSNLIDNDIEEN